MFAKGLMEVLPSHPFYTLIVNPTNTEIRMLNHMVFAKLSNNLSPVVDPEVTGQLTMENNDPKISAVSIFSTHASKQPLKGKKRDETVDSEW